MNNQELLIEARTQIAIIAKETKKLWANDAYEVVFIEKTDGSSGVTQIQKGWRTNNTCIRIGNYPMTKKQVSEVLDEFQFEIETCGY